MLAGNQGIEHRSPFVSVSLILHHVFSDNHLDSNGSLKEKVLGKEVFRRHFPRSTLPTKQGFSGFPNEALSLLMGTSNEFSHLEDYLRCKVPTMRSLAEDPRLQWKLGNTELWLRSI